jgi:hypothetical protein
MRHRALLEGRRARLNRAIAALYKIQEDADPHAALQRFMTDAAWDRWEAKRQQVAVARPPDRAPASALALFREIAVALDRGRPSAQRRSQTLLARSRQVIAPETRDGWSRRAAWPDGLRRYVASCYEMDLEIWERVVGFIDREYEAPR